MKVTSITSGAFIIGIENDSRPVAYRVLIYKASKKEDGTLNWQFKCSKMTDGMIAKSLSDGNHWHNVKISNNKLVGTTGSLSRFTDGDKNNGYKPMVFISQLINSEEKIIGYKVADFNGNIKNVPLKEVIAYGCRITKANNIPIQNAIFIPASEDNKKPHFKSYPNDSFIEELVQINKKNRYAEQSKVNTSKNEKTLSRIQEIYTTEQIVELQAGKRDGLDIKLFANPALSAEQMRVLREALKDGLNIKPIASPDYEVRCMKYYIMDMKDGLNIKAYLSPKYNLGQISELSLAAEEGLDLSKMGNPKNSAEEMAEIRERLERKIFKPIKVSSKPKNW